MTKMPCCPAAPPSIQEIRRTCHRPTSISALRGSPREELISGRTKCRRLRRFSASTATATATTSSPGSADSAPESPYRRLKVPRRRRQRPRRRRRRPGSVEDAVRGRPADGCSSSVRRIIRSRRSCGARRRHDDPAADFDQRPRRRGHGDDVRLPLRGARHDAWWAEALGHRRQAVAEPVRLPSVITALIARSPEGPRGATW